MTHGGIRQRAGCGRLLLAPLTVLLLFQAAQGQTRFMHLTGETVSPAFEGWWPNEDGSFTLFFGYMNSNWEQEFDVPVGPANYFAFAAAGALDDIEQEAFDATVADQGQPTHFYPRRNPFLFTVEVPEGFRSELVWTLGTGGTRQRVFASLAPDYRIDPQVISTEVGGNFGSLDDRLRTNVPPELVVEGEEHRVIAVGEPLTLIAFANDPDDTPARREDRGQPPTNLEELYRPPSSSVVQSGPGLRLSWIVYRGPARHVTFEPEQMKSWMDSRVWGNSPWSPPWIIPEPPEDGTWAVEATFREPGDYVLRAVASDGSLFSYQNLTVTVNEPSL